MSASCVWECLKEFCGWWLAATLIALLIAALAGYSVATGGVGAVTLTAVVAGVFESATGLAAFKAAGIFGGGLVGSIVGCLRAC